MFLNNRLLLYQLYEKDNAHTFCKVPILFRMIGGTVLLVERWVGSPSRM